MTDANLSDELSPSVVHRYAERLRAAAEAISVPEVLALGNELVQARRRGSTVLLAGNGGSASTVNHYAIDWMLGTEIENPPLRVVSLAESVSSVTATGNDQAFERVFSRQLERLGVEGDVVVLVSASGNSPNLIVAAETAHKIGMRVVVVTAFDGGKLREIADVSVHVPTKNGDYGVAEDLHLAIGHIVKELLIEALTSGE